MADDKEDGEKLFSTEKVADTQPAEVSKFIPENENQNGVSPITVDNVKSKFTGLTKEELMKYAKDPFWIRIRWFLFILYWVVWCLMLFGAIVVIIVTPKCKESPPPLWWQRSALYRIDVSQIPGEGDVVLSTLQNRINFLSNLGVETLLLGNVLSANEEEPAAVVNFTGVYPTLKNVDEFKKRVIDYANGKGVNIMIAFIPNFSAKNDKFIRSEVAENEFADYYVWYPVKYSSKPEKLPNNWLSVYNSPAWEWNEKRKQFYLHQFNVSEPEFNFTNPNVVNDFIETYKFWLKLGIKGFHFDKTEYLIESDKFEDELTNRNTTYGIGEYGFFYHSHTFELPQTAEVLANWSSVIRNNSAILSVSGGIRERKDISDFVLRPLNLPSNFTARDLQDRILKWKSAVNQPAWEWICDADCFSESVTDGLAIVSFLLPGTPVLKLGQELGGASVFGSNGTFDERLYDEVYKNQTSDVESHLNIVKELIRMRKIPSVTYGTFNSTIFNKTVFAFTRIKPGNPGYLVAWNIGQKNVTVNFREFSAIPAEFMIVLKSGHIFGNLYPLKSRLDSTNVELPAMAAAVFSFVPDLK